MQQKRNGEPGGSPKAKTQAGEGSQIDFSYNQWRRLCMQQLEQGYVAVCEDDLRLA